MNFLPKSASAEECGSDLALPALCVEIVRFLAELLCAQLIPFLFVMREFVLQVVQISLIGFQLRSDPCLCEFDGIINIACGEHGKERTEAIINLHRIAVLLVECVISHAHGRLLRTHQAGMDQFVRPSIYHEGQANGGDQCFNVLSAFHGSKSIIAHVFWLAYAAINEHHDSDMQPRKNAGPKNPVVDNV